MAGSGREACGHPHLLPPKCQAMPFLAPSSPPPLLSSLPPATAPPPAPCASSQAHCSRSTALAMGTQRAASAPPPHHSCTWYTRLASARPDRTNMNAQACRQACRQGGRQASAREGRPTSSRPHTARLEAAVVSGGNSLGRSSQHDKPRPARCGPHGCNHRQPYRCCDVAGVQSLPVLQAAAAGSSADGRPLRCRQPAAFAPHTPHPHPSPTTWTLAQSWWGMHGMPSGPRNAMAAADAAPAV